MLLDTSGLFCYCDRGDARHADAMVYFDSAPFKLTHSYVLAEFVPLFQKRRLSRVEALAFSWALLSNPEVDFVWVDEKLRRAALSLLQDRLDKDYSLCDAVSFLLMRQHRIADALTTDHHFEQEGFGRLLMP